MYDLFNEDLTGKGYQYVANWIDSCRKLVFQQEYSSYTEYVNAAAAICEEWEQHYKRNTSVYEDKSGKCSEIFQRALYYTTFLDRVTCGIDYINGKYSVPLTEAGSLSNLRADKSLAIGIQRAFRGEFESRYHFFLSAFANTEHYKDALDKRIKQRFYEETWDIQVMQGNRPIAASSILNLMSICAAETYTLKCSANCVKKSSYNNLLGDCGISKTTYHDFMGFTFSEKAFDKKMFVNIAFLLGFSYPLAERLLNLNGYTFEGSERAFDKICAKGFKLGFGHTLTNALIEKRNIELGGDRIPNLQTNNKALNVSTLLAP